MKNKKRRTKRHQPAHQAEHNLVGLVQQLFFAEEVPLEEIDENPVIAFVLDRIRTAPAPADPLN